uniref:Uncharacterized protein n=1 Tax=Romanomermis culicivorax TaxID=13658 RepID=A0A915HUR6_ROMCU
MDYGAARKVTTTGERKSEKYITLQKIPIATRRMRQINDSRNRNERWITVGQRQRKLRDFAPNQSVTSGFIEEDLICKVEVIILESREKFLALKFQKDKKHDC